MASIYRDLVAFEDEIIFEIEERMPEFSSTQRHQVRPETDALRAERDRLRRGVEFWEGQLES